MHGVFCTRTLHSRCTTVRSEQKSGTYLLRPALQLRSPFLMSFCLRVVPRFRLLMNIR